MQKTRQRKINPKTRQRKVEKTIRKKGYNPILIEEIQPQGGISFQDERIIKTGDGYEECLRIYQYPHDVHPRWLTMLMQANSSVAVIDLHPEDKDVIVQNINKSMKEHNYRYMESKEASEKTKAAVAYQELQELLSKIEHLGTVNLSAIARLFLCADEPYSLSADTGNRRSTLETEGYKAIVNLGETKHDWLSMFHSFSQQQKSTLNKRVDPVIPSDVLAMGNPFHFISLNDEMGTYLGYNNATGGTVVYSPWTISQNRISYNALVVGMQGIGKSTLLKKMVKDNAVLGNFIRIFDVMGDFTILGHYLGAKIINWDGSEGMLNMLEILRTDKDNDEFLCYANHITKLKTCYRYLKPTASEEEVTAFDEAVREMYEERELLPRVDHTITGLPSTSYPTFSDLLEFLTRKITGQTKKEEGLDQVIRNDQMKYAGEVRSVINNLVKNYGHIFDGHTTIDNLANTQVVIFNIKKLATIESSVFDAAVFNALSLCQDNAVQIGSKMRKEYDNKTIAWKDITRTMVVIDEAHRLVNTNKLQIVESLLQFERENRHYFAGLWLATQSIRDFVPEGSSMDSISKIKTLFELTQYKFLMKQNAASVGVLEQVFPNQISDEELKKIPEFRKGQTILSIAGDRNIETKISITAAENDIFAGGA